MRCCFGIKIKEDHHSIPVWSDLSKNAIPQHNTTIDYEVRQPSISICISFLLMNQHLALITIHAHKSAISNSAGARHRDDRRNGVLARHDGTV